MNGNSGCRGSKKSFVVNFCSLSYRIKLMHLENIRSCAWTGDLALLDKRQSQRQVLSIPSNGRGEPSPTANRPP